MSEFVANQPKTTCSAFGYFVLSFCLLVPTIGTIALFALLDHLNNERLAFGGAACVYLSSVILGLFCIKRFRKYHERTDFWALIVGITLSGISCLVATGALILSYVAAGLNIR
jgi:undecaprenyl pyrophosphate phosphatase UppP